MFFFYLTEQEEEIVDKLGEITIVEARDDEIIFDKVQSSTGLALKFWSDSPCFCFHADQTHVDPDCCDRDTR